MIKTESLTYIYPEGTRAVVDVNLEIKRGEIIALMGANGSGKTSLLKLIIRLLKPTSGNIFLDGKEYGKLKDMEIFQRVGMVFQDPNDQLFASTVEQDVSFGAINLGLNTDEVIRRVNHALKLVGITELAGRSIHTLSYGQKRRVSIAGVLAMQPDIILLDEPTGGLDPRSVTPVMQLLKSLNRDHGISMIIATHDVDLVPLFCDRVMVMHKGKIIIQDSPRNILGNPELARKISLRMPRVAHLSEILQKEDGIEFHHLPLTISEARREFLALYRHESECVTGIARRNREGKDEDKKPV